MPETITTLTGYEAKPGSNAQGAYVLNIFTDAEGKKFKTFDDDVAAAAKELIGPLVVLEFDVRSQNRNGRTFTDNFINSIKDASTVTTESQAGNGDVAAITPVATRLLAFRESIHLLETVPEVFGPDTPGLVGIMQFADTIYDWAAMAPTEDVEPEPEPEPAVTN